MKAHHLFCVAAVVAWSIHPAWAVCPSGGPGEIFCDDYDCYCNGSACNQDPPIKCTEGMDKNNGSMRQVWVLTSKNTANGNACGSEFNIEDSLQVFSEPFGNGLPCQLAAQLGHITVTINDDIQNTFGPGYLAVQGTDANPLVLSANLQNQTGGKTAADNVYFELTFGSDYAPTDYVTRDCALCDPPLSNFDKWNRVLCAQDVAIDGCPAPETAPLHASIAVGFVAYLDPDPCHCNLVNHGPKNPNLAVFDGQHWIKLTEGKFPGTGGFLLRDDLASVALTITSDTIQVEYTSYNEPAPPLTVREYSVATLPRQYLGAFDTLHAGMGVGCEINSSGWDTCAAARRCLFGPPGGGRPGNDDFSISGGEGFVPPPHTGPCCQPDGECVITSEAACDGTYQGDYLACGVVPCYAACDRQPYAAADADTDVDMDDFAEFQRCINLGGVTPECACFDRGYGFPDGKIDAADFEAFVGCSTGSNIAFVQDEHPDCPPHPGLPAPLWMHEDFESYADESAYILQWPIDIGAGLDFQLTGGIDGPKCVGGAKTYNRRHTHDLVQHIQAAPGGAGKTSVTGTDEAPLVFEGAYQLSANPDTARRQDFFFDLAKGTASAPRGTGSSGIKNVLAFGAFTAYNDSHIGYREGIMYFDGEKWIHLSGLKHGPGWNFLTVKVRTSTVEITYYDQAQTNGVQTQMLPRTYLGDFDTMGIDTDDCLTKVQAADSFKLGGGLFLP